MSPEELFRTGIEHLDAGRLQEAAQAFHRVVSVDPCHADALHELGILLHQGGQDQPATDLLARAAALRPQDYRFQFNAGAAFKRAARLQEAIDCFGRAADLRRDADTLSALGESLREANRLSEAVAALRSAVRLRPGFADAWNNLGRALQEQCQTDAAIEAYRAALTAQPRFAVAQQNLLLCLNYDERVTDDELFAEHQAFGRLYAPGGKARIAPHRPAADGRIRIGYLSADFRQHSVAFFILAILKAHDRGKFHITAYADVRRPDALTAEMQRHCDRWRQTSQAGDDELARLVAEDEVDILVELAGHTAGNRLPLLARRIAPIQVTYLGYPNTTGLTNMDYRLTDAVADPPGTGDALYSERLVRLPGAFFSYVGLSGAPDVGPLPAGRVGHVTFGVFCNLAKVQPHTVRRWSQVLHGVPQSRLLIQSAGLSDEPTRQRLGGLFRQAGVASDRLELQGWVDFPIYLRQFGQVDIVLDTFPFCGHTTTCHALWMGVPVVTLAGQSHRSRMGASIMTHLKLPELVATSDGEFLRIASELAGDTARLASLRAGLRERTRQALCDADSFARRLEGAYTQMVNGQL